ncbi:MAG: hypothetical protein KKC19_01720 [Nanoarchaeota archaeon]|nr:hypothetical protein [Nanoarchaeota archaeon]
MTTNSDILIGTAVVIINLIPLLTKKYKYLLVTAILSLILMYIGMMI